MLKTSHPSPTGIPSGLADTVWQPLSVVVGSNLSTSGPLPPYLTCSTPWWMSVLLRKGKSFVGFLEVPLLLASWSSSSSASSRKHRASRHGRSSCPRAWRKWWRGGHSPVSRLWVFPESCPGTRDAGSLVLDRGRRVSGNVLCFPYSSQESCPTWVINKVSENPRRIKIRLRS